MKIERHEGNFPFWFYIFFVINLGLIIFGIDYLLYQDIVISTPIH
jgi:hypothetical protein